LSISKPPFLAPCITLVGLAWLGNAAYALAEAGSYLQLLASAPVAVGMIGFLFLHGSYRYGMATMVAFVSVVFVAGWGFEMLSILTGFPFGNYHYTESMRPFIGQVPVFVMPAYGVMGYVCWSMAHILTGKFDDGADRRQVTVIPLVAALLMVVWDLSMDPLRSTLEQRWIWIEGGWHFGVPLSNSFGWLVVTWTMFQAFAVYLKVFGDGNGRDGTAPARLDENYWGLVPLMYVAFAVEYVLNPFLRDDYTILEINGVLWSAAELFAAIAVLCCLTMAPIAGWAMIIVVRRFGLPASFGKTNGLRLAAFASIQPVNGENHEGERIENQISYPAFAGLAPVNGTPQPDGGAGPSRGGRQTAASKPNDAEKA